jgi:hypothetical protein
MGNSITAEIPESADGVVFSDVSLSVTCDTPAQEPREYIFAANWAHATLQCTNIVDASGKVRYVQIPHIENPDRPAPLGIPREVEGERGFTERVGKIDPAYFSLHNTCNMLDNDLCDPKVMAVIKTSSIMASGYNTEFHCWILNPKTNVDAVFKTRGLPHVIIGGNWNEHDLLMAKLSEDGKSIQPFAKITRWRDGEQGFVNKPDDGEDVDPSHWFRLNVAAGVDNAFVILLLQAVQRMTFTLNQVNNK